MERHIQLNLFLPGVTTLSNARPFIFPYNEKTLVPKIKFNLMSSYKYHVAVPCQIDSVSRWVSCKTELLSPHSFCPPTPFRSSDQHSQVSLSADTQIRSLRTLLLSNLSRSGGRRGAHISILFSPLPESRWWCFKGPHTGRTSSFALPYQWIFRARRRMEGGRAIYGKSFYFMRSKANGRQR